ncbi:MAG: hypothetical protein JW867_09185 [Candidatus Omnitrophica bacterium]|nr:hypothetical protein [Candidatus Omnitrophota bacterium]
MLYIPGTFRKNRFPRQSEILVFILALFLAPLSFTAKADSQQVNLLQNPDFESGFDSWKITSNSADSQENIVYKGCYEGACLEFIPGSGTIQQITQVISGLTPGSDYSFSLKYKTSESHYGFFRVKDLDWRIQGSALQEKTLVDGIFHGDGEWISTGTIFHIPVFDDSGAATIGHRYSITIYGHYPYENNDPVYYDNIEVKKGNWFFDAFGCKDEPGSAYIDFGPADKKSNPYISYSRQALDEGGVVSGITYRNLQPRRYVPFKGDPACRPSQYDGDCLIDPESPDCSCEEADKEGLILEFPAFNVDAEGYPLSPMLLEISYRDLVDDTYGGSVTSANHRVKVYSKIGFVCNDPRVAKDKDYLAVTSLPGHNDLFWKYSQYAFNVKSEFPMLKAIDGKFTFKIEMPSIGWVDRSLVMPLDYVSLNVISEDQYQEFTNRERQLSEFYEVTLPANNKPLSYDVPAEDLVVFSRDPMEPVYEHTKPRFEDFILVMSNEPILEAGPSQNTFSALKGIQPQAIKSMTAISARGEIEPLSFVIYSEKGLEGLNFEASELVNPSKNSSITDIDIYHIVYDKKRHLPRPNSLIYFEAYALVPDHLQPLSTLSIPAGTSKRIWLKVNIPKDIAAGDYTGEVLIRDRFGQLLDALPMKLTVLDFELEPCPYINYVYHDPYSRTLSSDLNQAFALFREADFTPIMDVLNIGMKKNSSNTIDFDTADFEDKIDEMIDQGLIKDHCILYFPTDIWNGIYKTLYYPESATKVYDTWEKLNKPDFQESFKDLIRLFMDIGSDRGVEFIFSVSDEPNNYSWPRLICDRLFRLIKEAGGLTTVTYSNKCDLPAESGNYIVPGGVIEPLTDLVDYKVWAGTHQDEGFSKSNGQFGYYTTGTTTLKNMIYSRFLHGLLAERTDADIIGSYAMAVSIVDPFNDFDLHPQYRHPFSKQDYLLVYPAKDGRFMPTVDFEGIREGVKDAKYISTLKKLIRENPDDQFAQQAQDYLQSLRDKISPSYWSDYAGKSDVYGFYDEIIEDLSNASDPLDYSAFTNIRNDIINYIIKLRPSAPVQVTSPGDFTARAVLPEEVHLSWSYGFSKTIGFMIWRKDLEQDLPFTVIALIGPNTRMQVDKYRLTPKTRYQYRIQAFTESGRSDYSFAEVTTPGYNQPPVFELIDNQEVDAGNLLELTVSASDPDADVLTYSAQNLPEGATFINQFLSWRPASDQVGTYDVTFLVSDGELSDSATISITVNEVIEPIDAPTYLTGVPMSSGNIYMFWKDNSDNEDGFIIERGLDDVSFEEITRVVENKQYFIDRDVNVGIEYYYRVRAFNVQTYSGYSNVIKLMIEPEKTNHPPVLDRVQDLQVTEGERKEVIIRASDPDEGDSLTFSLENNPYFIRLINNQAGSVTLAVQPGFLDQGIYSDIKIRVQDNAEPSLGDEELFTVTVGDSNRKPVLEPLENQRVAVGGELILKIRAADPDSNHLTFSTGELPQGAAFIDNNDNTATFSFRPAINQVKVHRVVFSVSDGRLSDSITIDIEVYAKNRPPVMNELNYWTTVEGYLMSTKVSATDPDNDPLTLSVENLPRGATFVDNGNGSGLFSWKPGWDQAGKYQIIFTASDGSLSDSKPFNITVGNQNYAPTFNPISDKQAIAGGLLEFTISAKDRENDPLTLSVSSLPQGASFVDHGNGRGTFSWRPGQGQAGEHLVIFNVSDGSLSYYKILKISVTVLKQ